MRRNYWSQSTPTTPVGDGPRGHWMDGQDFNNPKLLSTVTHHVRPLIDSQLHPEGKTTWKPDQFWCFRTQDSPANAPTTIGNSGGLDANGGNTGQDVKWEWADPAGKNEQKVFSINNLNFGNMNQINDPNQVFGHYRFMPDDGTYAVVDELKISNKDTVLRDDAPDWDNDRVVREQYLSRYYLPPNASDPAVSPANGGPPTFTSQSLLQSLKGFDKSATNEQVSVVRVAWTVFTPRFMGEYKGIEPARYTRNEKLTYNGGPYNSAGGPTAQIVAVPYRGPFDYLCYNDRSCIGDFGDDGNGRKKTYLSVARPSPLDYGGQAHAARGVQVEILRDLNGIPDDGDELVLGTFTNPDALNTLGSLASPVRAFGHELRYRIRFRYPVDPLVDPKCGKVGPDGRPAVDVQNQYLLDTPVFDDISVTYFSKPRILGYREIRE
jgi:hypothetical protein